MSQVIIRNKVARYDYALTDVYEAGLELAGWEVKSIRAKNVSFNNAFCTFKGNELFVANLHISNYMSVPGEVDRSRKLLLKRSELRKLAMSVQAKGLTIVPLSLKWSNSGYVKLDIALGRGKSNYDKRESIKARDNARVLAKIKKYYAGV